jgi:hypothetical protein
MSYPQRQMVTPGTTQWNAVSQRWMVWDGSAWQWSAPQQQVVQQQGPTSSVHYEKQPMAHTMHLILTILTAGMWGLFVWLPLGLLHSMSRGRKVTTKYR